MAVLSPHKRYHMGFRKIIGGSNETKKEAARKQNTKSPENSYNITYIKHYIYRLNYYKVAVK